MDWKKTGGRIFNASKTSSDFGNHFCLKKNMDHYQTDSQKSNNEKSNNRIAENKPSYHSPYEVPCRKEMDNRYIKINFWL